MSGWNVSADARKVTAAQVAGLYNSVGFGVPDRFYVDQKLFAQMYGPGCFGFFVFVEEELIGAARVLSDDAITSCVSELVVHPDWQEKGVGTALINTVKNRFSHTAIYLHAFLGQHGFFEKNGIKPREVLVSCSRASQARIAG